MSSTEFSEWMAYYQMEPFGGERGDLQAAIIASTIANTQRDPKRKPSPFKVADFMPRLDEEREAEGMPWQQQLKLVEMLNTAFGGVDKREKHGDTGDISS